MMLIVTIQIMRFEVLRAVELMMVFWIVRLCGLVGRYHCFGEMYLFS
jgi:hypothetical protein